MNFSPSLNAVRLRARLAAWFGQFGRDLPWRRTTDPYAIMVSEFMLQQTQVATVIPFYERWLRRFPDFTSLAQATEAEVLAHWQGLGYYARARNLHRAAKEVAVRHGGVLPPCEAAIRDLPGVGPYTTGAIASFAFDLPVAAVDANIARVLARLINLDVPVDSKAGTEAVWAAAEALLPAGSGGRIHTSALMELGALVCVPRQPQCLVCPIRQDCQAKEPERLPLKKPRRATARLIEDCLWSLEDGRVLLEQQNGTRWKGLWKLPRLAEPPSATPLLEMEYPFTHHRVTLRVFSIEEPTRVEEQVTGGEWVALTNLESTAITAPHKRAILELLSRD